MIAIIRLRGRLTEILDLSNGENIAAAALEMAIAAVPLFEQVIIIGEGHAFLSALVVLNPGIHEALLAGNPDIGKLGIHTTEFREYLLQRIFPLMHEFPGYMQISGVAVIERPWTAENGWLTMTLKLKRQAIEHRFRTAIEEIYREHGTKA